VFPQITHFIYMSLHRWEQINHTGDIYSPRTGHACVCDGEYFYLFGGTDGSARQSDVHICHMETREWQKIKTNGIPPSARSGAQAVVLDRMVWFFGGYTKKDGEYFNDVHSYSIESHYWASVNTLGEPPSRRTDHSIVLYKGSLFLFGGFDGRNRYNDLRQFKVSEKRWHNISSTATAPSSRFGHTAVIYQNSMFIFGGWDGHDTMQETHEYNFPINQWYPLQPRGQPPQARYRHSAIVAFDNMYTFGGVDKSQNRFQDVFIFNLTRREWSQVHTSGMSPSPRTFHKSVVHADYMYILGGFDGRRQNDTHRIKLFSGNPGPSSSSTREMGAYGNLNAVMAELENSITPAVGDDTEGTAALMPEDFWVWQGPVSQCGQLYTPRTGHEVVVWNNRFYLMGGTDENARQNDIYQLDVQNMSWSLLEPVTGNTPSARSGSKAVVYRDSIYFFGGYTKKDGDYFNDLFEFNIPKAHWTKVQSNGSYRPSVRTDHSAVIYGACMYIFGGFDGKSRFQDLQKYNFDEKLWTKIPDSDHTPMGRFGHSSCMYQSSMFIFGGWNGHDTLDDLAEFSTVTTQWYSVPGRGDVPMSRYRHSAVVYGCCMFLFGGVDKKQARFNDLYCFNFEDRCWSQIRTSGDPPTSRTFHRAVMYSGYMYILGGFDGTRRNDMYKIPLLETLPRDQKIPRKFQKNTDNAPDEEEIQEGDETLDRHNEEDDVVMNLRKQVRELERRLETEEERHICKICYEREINTVILHCNHRVVCLRCLEQVQNCPLCRLEIKNTIQTYNA